MKKLAFMTLICLVGASVVFGGAKRITESSGTITDTIVNADSSNGSAGYMILTAPQRLNHDLTYDRIMLRIKANQWDSLGGTGALSTLRLKDSLIVWLIAKWGGIRDTLRIDTIVDFTKEKVIQYPVPLWDTTRVNNYRIIGDSTGGVSGIAKGVIQLPSPVIGMFFDEIFFDYRNIDSGGTGTDDSSTAVINWRMRLIEED